ncbi:MAG: protein kinase [Planctomycetaceae bacterium]|nr:protein kinase [Planctomycetaceae bacterium]
MAAPKKPRLIQVGPFVGVGERKAAECLDRELPGGWRIICNKELVDPDGSTREVDFIVVAPHTIFIIDEKSWSGAIHGNETGWVLRTGESYINPLGKVNHVAKRLAGLLRRNIPRLKDKVTEHFVLPRIVLSADDVRLFVHDPRIRDQVVRLSEVGEHFPRIDRQQAHLASIEPFAEQIVAELAGLQDRPKIPRNVGDFEILETLDCAGVGRTLRAKHRDGSERILKLIPRPSTAVPEDIAAYDNLCLREYEALKRLSGESVAPGVDPYFSWEDGSSRVIPQHLVKGQSLRAHRTEGAPAAEEIVPVVEAAFRGLSRVHDAGVVHRGLTPDRIFLDERGNVVFTGFAIARIRGLQTVAGEAREIDPENQYTAFECRVSLEFADTSSDVYSLAASLFYWISGYEPELGAESFPRLGRHRADLMCGPAAFLEEILATCLGMEQKERPTAADVVRKIIEEQGRREEEARRRVQADVLKPGEIVENQYEVLRVLGQGGTADAYLARDEVSGDMVVLKRIRNPELTMKLAKAEFQSLKELHHPNLPKVRDVRPSTCKFHLSLEYVAGAALREIKEQFANPEGCLRIGKDVLAALAYLGGRGLIHRDVSPSNILIPEEEQEPVRLIDFGLATAEAEASSHVGTPPYRAPEVERGERWSPTCDMYSLGVVLFELLTGRFPYRIEDDRRLKDQLIPFTQDEEQRFGGELLRVLLRSAAPNPSDRFPTAEEFSESLQRAVREPSPAPVPGLLEVLNPFVDELRRAYRNSRIGNTNNRGLESDFSRDTYVETRLDKDLLPRIVDGNFRLVILSGNPGDGKTAFLQRLYDRLRDREAKVEAESAAGWRLRCGESVFAALYDASESHEGRSADDLFHEVLDPLAGRREPKPGYCVGIAVNDGRLRDFFETYGNSHYPWLWERLRPQLADRCGQADGVLLIDMKRRCVVGTRPDAPSLFSGILDRFLEPPRWQICETCKTRQHCPIFANVQSFRDPSLTQPTRLRLTQLLMAVHLRRERRATIRDLRSALAYVITHDLGCDDVHRESREGRWLSSDSNSPYYQSVFDGSGSPDLLLDEWQQLDPALVPSPRLDRYLHFHRGVEQVSWIETLFHAAKERPMPAYAVDSAGARIASLKRRYVFEANESEACARRRFPNPSNLLPYRHFQLFCDALSEVSDLNQLRDALLRGMSRADGVPDIPAEAGLALRLTDASNDDLVVMKLYSADTFRLIRPPAPEEAVESVRDYMVLQNVNGTPRLIIGLDLFEFLMRAAEGCMAGPEEQRALVEDLAIFKNQLLTQPAQEVLILEAGHRTHRVGIVDGKLVREEVAI